MNLIHLQGFGKAQAKPASQLKVGDMTLWNFGYKHKITNILKETNHTVIFELDGKPLRRLSKKRLVAFC